MNNITLKLNSIVEQYYNASYDDGDYYSQIEKFLNLKLTDFLIQYQVKHTGKLRKDLKNFVLNFINNPNKQYFYIETNDTFILYDGKSYEIVKEDAILYSILNTVSHNHIVTPEQKQALKNKIIYSIKKQSILNSIPDSYTIQNILKYMNIFCLSKPYSKYILTIIGDCILKKNLDKIYLLPEKSKDFIDYVELHICELLGRTNCIKNIKYKWHSHNYKLCRIIEFDNSILMTESWEQMLKKHYCDFIVVATHYSEQYGDADKYLQYEKNTLNETITYLIDKNSKDIVDDFVGDFISSDEKLKISWEDMVYIWKDWIKKKNIPIPLYQKTLKEELQKKFEWNAESDSFMKCTSIHILYVECFKKFWEQNVKQNLDECIEISEMKDIYFNWLRSYNFGPHSDYKNYFLSERKIRHIINHFYKEIEIHEKKYIIGVVCDLWDKKKSIFEILEKLTFNNEEMNINYINLYKLYCRKCKEEKQLIVSKKYFTSNIENIIDKKYLNANTVSIDFWN